MSTKKKSRNKRVHKKLEQCFQDGDLYEAEQLLKSFHKRLNGQKKFEQSISLLIEGAKRLFEHDRGAAGMSICMDLLDTWKLSCEQPSESEIEVVSTLFALIPKNTPPDLAKNYFKAVCKWVEDTDQKSENIEESAKSKKDNMLFSLNKMAAEKYSKSGNFAEASTYYLRAGGCTKQHSKLLRAWSAPSPRLEKDLFVARAVLQYICLGRLKEAQGLLQEFDFVPKEGSTPVANFVAIFFESCAKRQEELYFKVASVYQSLLEQEPDFNDWVRLCGQRYFNHPAPKQAGGLMGMLGNMMG